MKEGIHPNYQQTTITCACGNVIETGSTKKDIKVEVCSKCHPFYTGKQKMVDTGGRVSRFNFGLILWFLSRRRCSVQRLLVFLCKGAYNETIKDTRRLPSC